MEKNEKKPNNKGSIMLYKKPTLIGLNDLGGTCFINAALQCLSQTKSLTNYFLNEKNKTKIMNNNIYLNNKDEPQLSPVYYELIHYLWEENDIKAYSPNNFMNIINKINPLFKSGQVVDSKDCIIFILEQLHKELKNPLIAKNSNNSETNIPYIHYNKTTALHHFIENFKNNVSVISDVFYGVIK